MRGRHDRGGGDGHYYEATAVNTTKAGMSVLAGAGAEGTGVAGGTLEEQVDRGEQAEGECNLSSEDGAILR